jgi:hypothetical protein
VHSLVGTVIVASKEVLMAKTVDVTIPLDPEAAKALDTPARREAVGAI